MLPSLHPHPTIPLAGLVAVPAFILPLQPVPCLLTSGPSAQYSLIQQWNQGHGKLGLLSFPCPNTGRRPLGNKTATTMEKKKIYIYISRTSLKDSNGWNQSPTKPTGNKSKISPQGQARVHVPAGAQQPGSMSRPPCWSGLGTSVASIGARSSSSWGKSGSDRAVPLAGSSLEREAQVET